MWEILEVLRRLHRRDASAAIERATLPATRLPRVEESTDYGLWLATPATEAGVAGAYRSIKTDNVLASRHRRR
jgi:hypothetical protein